MNAEQFNEKFNVGDEVIYINDFGKHEPTKTRSEAWELGSGDAVVLLEGKRGGYSVDRIKKP